jgi:hypothetical protein
MLFVVPHLHLNHFPESETHYAHDKMETMKMEGELFPFDDEPGHSFLAQFLLWLSAVPCYSLLPSPALPVLLPVAPPRPLAAPFWSARLQLTLILARG